MIRIARGREVNINIRYIAVAAASATLAACEPAAEESAEMALARHLEEIEAIYSASYSADRPPLDAYLDYFTEDTVLLHPGGRTIEGKDAARDFYSSAFADIEIVALDYSTPDTRMDGHLAVRIYFGTGEFRIGDDPTVRASTNRYIDVLEQQANGKWLIVWHAWYPVGETD